MIINHKKHILYDGPVLTDINSVITMLSENGINIESTELVIKLTKKEEAKIIISDNIPRYIPINIQKKQSVNEVKIAHGSALKILSGDVTTEERDTWPVQLQASQAFIAKKATDSQKKMLDLLLIDNETKTELSNRIIQKNTKMQTLIGVAGGLKRKTIVAIESAETVDQLTGIMQTASTKMDNAITAFKGG